MRLFLYSMLRLVLVAAFVGLGYVLGLRGWLLYVLAVILAAAASYILLSGPRNAAVDQLASEVEKRRARRSVDLDAEVEDAADDAAREASAAPLAPAASAPALDETGPTLSERESHAENHAVGELEEPRALEDSDELPPGRRTEDGPRESPRGDR